MKKDAGSTKQLARPFELKELKEDGTFEGYGSVFGVVDSYADIVKKGAFKRSLKEHKSAGSMPKLLWQHRSDEPIGVYQDVAEDDHGLFVKGQLALKTARGAEAYELLKMGAIGGLSIGYMTIAYEWDEKTRVRTLTDIDLWECSLVTFPANPAAQVSGVKRTVPTERLIEHVLMRDAGLSRSQARVVITQGFKALKTKPGAGLSLQELLATCREARQRTAKLNQE